MVQIWDKITRKAHLVEENMMAARKRENGAVAVLQGERKKWETNSKKRERERQKRIDNHEFFRYVSYGILEVGFCFKRDFVMGSDIHYE